MTRKLVETSCRREGVMGVSTSRKTAGRATAQKSRVKRGSNIRQAAEAV